MVHSKANEDFLIAEAHAKINLHLEVLGFRSDGFHELAMVMQSINLSDQLKMIKRADNNSLILGDEPCSGTEHISAISIVSSSIKLLCDKMSSFIFATHLHKLSEISFLKNSPRM